MENLQKRVERLEKIVDAQTKLLQALVEADRNTTDVLNVVSGILTEETNTTEATKSEIPSFLKVGCSYKPTNPVSAIEGVRNSYGTILDVEDNGDSWLVTADYGIEKGNPAHIFMNLHPKKR